MCCKFLVVVFSGTDFYGFWGKKYFKIIYPKTENTVRFMLFATKAG
jgi:hypothetical protein